MTREEVINLMSQMIKDGEGFLSDYTIEAEKMALEALKNQREWIPVSERLPKEENKHYWICTDCDYQCECRWTNVNHIWTDLTTDWHWHIMDIPQYSKVIAWMPLPEPYKAERGE